MLPQFVLAHNIACIERLWADHKLSTSYVSHPKCTRVQWVLHSTSALHSVPHNRCTDAAQGQAHPLQPAELVHACSYLYPLHTEIAAINWHSWLPQATMTHRHNRILHPDSLATPSRLPSYARPSSRGKLGSATPLQPGSSTAENLPTKPIFKPKNNPSH